jgi:hypothetical protein
MRTGEEKEIGLEDITVPRITGEITIPKIRLEDIREGYAQGHGWKRFLRRPRSRLQGELAKAGLASVGNTDNPCFECVECHRRWMVNLFSHHRLPRHWWRCPNGCNTPTELAGDRIYRFDLSGLYYREAGEPTTGGRTHEVSA